MLCNAKKDGNRVTKHSAIEEVFVIDSERFSGEKTRQPASVLIKFDQVMNMQKWKSI